MMNRIFMALALCLSAGVALAQDAKPDAGLTVQDAMLINSSLGQMNCETKLLRDGSKETSACIPYPADKLKPGLAWDIARNQRKLSAVAQDYQRQVVAFLGTLPRKPDGNLTDEANVKFQNFQAELLAKPALLPGETLKHFKKADLDALNLQPSILSGLLPIVDE